MQVIKLHFYVSHNPNDFPIRISSINPMSLSAEDEASSLMEE